MACTCIQSSSSSRARNFDVFVSFRGEDTRNGFTNHLFAALQRQGIVAFRDDQKIKKGELIGPELEQAIEGSRVFIVVFSKNYASSTWCLQELAKIVDWVEVTGASVLPVFYDVTPSEVQKQSGNFAKAFAEHEERFKDDLEMVKKWREALKVVTNRCGWDVQNKLQHEEIEKIVEEVANILGFNQILSFGDDLVDMDSRVERLEELLDLGSNEVRVVGICGMGGIGKTTLAIALFNKISRQYNACCFVDDVSKFFWESGAAGIQKQLLCQALNQENMQINCLSHGTMLVRTRLCHLKALIVLDNVDQIEQLEKLALHPRFLGAGSRIIIISRDSHILRNHGVNEVYNVQLLDTDKALQLFHIKAFKYDNIVKDYEPLAYDVLQYANGLPLAIKVLGSFLFGRNVSEWRSAVVRLKENPNKDILDVLQISYDGLQDLEKQIFLDIACFFSECPEHYVKEILDCCGFHYEIGIRVLVNKSLIDNSYEIIKMHDLLRELGKRIVKDNSPKEPGRWSRLWLDEDFYNVTSEAMETKNTEAVVLRRYRESKRMLMINAEGLSKMSHLRLLILRDVEFMGSLKYLSNILQYLDWWEYPFSYLPSSFQPNKLVELNLRDSSIKQLWKGIKCLPNLRAMDLSNSKNLIDIPDFRGIPNLEGLILKGCIKLVSIHPSVGLLSKLAHLNLKNCKNLVSLPNSILGLNSLEYLNISGCPKVFSNQLLDKPIQKEHFKMLDIRETAMQSHSSSSSSFFKRLMLPFCSSYSRGYRDSAGYLLPSLPSFSCLYYLNLSFCNLSQIPVAIGCLHCLAYLNLRGNNFVSLPCSISKLSKLVYLNLEHGKQLRYLPEMPSPTAMPRIRESFHILPFSRGLYIFNCPNIVDIERCRGMAFGWLIQVLQVSQESSTLIGWKDRIHIVIPASEIPRWFDNQSVGTSISLDPSPILHAHNNWIGIACCVVFVALHHPTNLSHKWASLRIGFQGKFRPCFLPIYCFDMHLITAELHHLWVVYLAREEFCSFLGIEKLFDLDEMKMVTSAEYLNVIKCGYQWVFKEDLEQLNPTMKHRRCSNIQVDDDSVKGSSILPLEHKN